MLKSDPSLTVHKALHSSMPDSSTAELVSDGSSAARKRAMQRRRGLLLALLGTCCFSPDAMMTRLINAQRSPAEQEGSIGAPCVIAAYKSLVLGVLNVLACAFLDGGCSRMLSGLRSGCSHVMVASMFQAVQQLGFTLCYTLTDPATALLLISLNPLWAALLGWFVLHDALPTRTLACLFLACVCVLVVVVPPLVMRGDGKNASVVIAVGGGTGRAGEALAGDCVAFITGLSVAAYIIVVRHAASKCPDASMSASAGIGALVASGLASLIAAASGAPLTQGVHASAFVPLVIVDASSLAVGYVGMTIAPRHINGAEVAMVLLLQVLLAPLLVYFGVGEAPSHWVVVGGTLLLCVLLAHEIVGASALRKEEREARSVSVAVDGRSDDVDDVRLAIDRSAADEA
jgi:drug/metabolite transporter (DMT)-like permease